jgi:hypothetical protein
MFPRYRHSSQFGHVSPNVGSAATAHRAQHVSAISPFGTFRTRLLRLRLPPRPPAIKMFRDIAFGHISDTLLAVTPWPTRGRPTGASARRRHRPNGTIGAPLVHPASQRLRSRKLTVN